MQSTNPRKRRSQPVLAPEPGAEPLAPPIEQSADSAQISPRYQPKTPAFRRYVSTYALACLGISLMIGALSTVLLPLHVQSLEFARIFGADSGVDLTALANLGNDVAAGTVVPTAEQQHQLGLLAEFNSSKASSLSLVNSAGVVLLMILQPIIGTLSDRTRSRWGRRAPYVASGAVAGAALIALMPVAPSIAVLVIVWSLIQLASGLVGGPLSATVADRVPEERLGTVSAVTGLVAYAAAIGGAYVAGILFSVIGLASYYAIAIAVALLTIPFLLIARDRSSRSMPREPIRIGTIFASFVVALRDRDYRLAWISKVLFWLGVGISSTYGIYMLQSYISPALSAAKAAQLAPLMLVAALPATLLSMAIAGRFSDRLQRRKPFVIAAALILAVGLLVPWVWPTLPAMFIQAVVGGLGLGAFFVVDQALFIDLLPDENSSARDLGMAAMAQSLGTAGGPIIAGVVVTVAGGAYGPVWPVGAVVVMFSALAILPIRRAR
ncbi:MFS transporter [Nonomuraea sp. H19]|uniref:MFS transporter n=1 Tax=Nonomuraea sp. H19 TaxID=3452206 RepID=UPI003F8BF28F